MTSPIRDARRLPSSDLRWICDPSEVGASSTAEIPPLEGIADQEDAIEALRFGLETRAPGQNIFVRGLSGTWRSDLLRRLIEEISPPSTPSPDRCYVRNFERPDRPALITLPPGRGRAFQEEIDELIAYLGAELIPGLGSDAVKERRAALDQALAERLKALGEPFEKELGESGLALVMAQTAGGPRPAIVPLVEGEPAPPARLRELAQQGKVTREELAGLRAKSDAFSQRLDDLNRAIAEAREKHRLELRDLIIEEARSLLDFTLEHIRRAFPGEAVERFLDGILEDVVTHQLSALEEGRDLARRYRVNLIAAHEENASSPLLIETQPTLANLLGTIDRQMLPGGGVLSDHLMIRPGALLRADGGYLVLEARDVLSEPGAWKVLVRTLRTGLLEIRPQESLLFGSTAMLQPEPIPVRVKVVLIGDPGIYRGLDSSDPDFPQLFKVLADFEPTLPRSPESVRAYAGILSRVAREEELLPFAADAVAALAEHGARIAGRNDRLTTRASRLLDLAREADYLAGKRAAKLISGDDVRQAVQRTKRRADLPARRFREAIAEGIIRIQTRGRAVGQVNGLAVTHAGPLTYGFPARITATVGPGSRGTVNIEGEAHLSGAIHTKGFAILGGLLRYLLRGIHHPLAFSASIAFEQSYGGIDGDSASGAETCCLLSALTGVPLDQSVAMTGAIDQFGNIEPIGAATEKIEGFFDACVDAGLTGEQGVIIPHANRRDLMLRRDVVAACEEGRFHVWTVETIGEALEIFTGLPAGEADPSGHYPEGSLLRLATERVDDFWRMARGLPPEEDEEEDQAPPDAQAAPKA